MAKEIRNISIVGHGGCGKTTLCEAILYVTNTIQRMGSVKDGTTVSDYGDDEIKRTISIDLSVLRCEYDGVGINLLDTPGYQDFVGEAKKGLAACDSVLVVMDATQGVEVGTEIMWGYATDQGIPKMIFLNKMEKENADFFGTLENIKETLEITPTPLQLPIGEGLEFKGIVDLLRMKALVYGEEGVREEEIPKGMEDGVLKFRERLIEAIADTDDRLTEKYLEGEEFSEEELIRGLSKGIRESRIIPLLCGSGERVIGIHPLLDAIVNVMPSPLLREGILAKNPISGEEEIVYPKDPSFAAHVFKVTSDPYVGELVIFRVFSGELKTGDEIYNGTTGKKERVTHISLLHGKERREIQSVGCGDIAAFVKLKGLRTSDTISSPSRPVCFKEIVFPSPLTSVAVNPKTKADQEKLSTALAKLQEEDPTFKVRFAHELGQTIISGMGELHLEVMVDRLTKRFGVEINVERPKIAYREAITMPSKGEGKYKKQSGGRGQYGHCFLDIEPLPQGQGFEFVNKIFGGAIPSKYIPAIEKGVKDTMAKGILAGYPVIDTKVTLYDGTFHEVDSSDLAFQIAASFAFKKAFEGAGPRLLEPIMEVEVIAPEQDMGGVIGDLNSRRGKIQGVEPKGKNQVVRAFVPEAEMFKYSSTLRSLTGGRGTYSMKFAYYEEVPPHIAQSIIQESKKG